MKIITTNDMDYIPRDFMKTRDDKKSRDNVI